MKLRNTIKTLVLTACKGLEKSTPGCTKQNCFLILKKELTNCPQSPTTNVKQIFLNRSKLIIKMLKAQIKILSKLHPYSTLLTKKVQYFAFLSDDKKGPSPFQESQYFGKIHQLSVTGTHYSNKSHQQKPIEKNTQHKRAICPKKFLKQLMTNRYLLLFLTKTPRRCFIPCKKNWAKLF
jgi:hypothetical protein